MLVLQIAEDPQFEDEVLFSSEEDSLSEREFFQLTSKAVIGDTQAEIPESQEVDLDELFLDEIVSHQTPVKRLKMSDIPPPPEFPQVNVILLGYFFKTPFSLESLARIKFVQLVVSIFSDLEANPNREELLDFILQLISLLQEWTLTADSILYFRGHPDEQDSEENASKLSATLKEFSQKQSARVVKYMQKWSPICQAILSHDLHQYHAQMSKDILKALHGESVSCPHIQCFVEYFQGKLEAKALSDLSQETKKLASYYDFEYDGTAEFGNDPLNFQNSRVNLFSHEFIE